jgi:hypothetical protein
VEDEEVGDEEATGYGRDKFGDENEKNTEDEASES